jgi:serine/threonine protein kinase
VSKTGSSRSLQRGKSFEDDADASTKGEQVIEEKRKRANGEGYTIHRYTLGRMLGKGGFAKVYQCTSMDNGKSYAVKVVPKANLVKARARQKVRTMIGFGICSPPFGAYSHALLSLPSVASRDQDPS